MDVTEQINARLQTLPPPLRRAALEFIEFLAERAAQHEAINEETEWTNFSLAQAMEGLENEDSPQYSEADIKEKWQ
jgi:hypothetical protein